MAAWIFIMVHLTVCAGIAVLWKWKKWRTRYMVGPAVLLVPVWGVWMFAKAEYRCYHPGKQEKMPDTYDFKITEIKYRQIEEWKGWNEQVVPLEDAVLFNAPKMRRRLLMEVLHYKSEGYLDVLQEACVSGDVELTHYATTALLEIQGKHEAESRRKEREAQERLWQEEPGQPGQRDLPWETGEKSLPYDSEKQVWQAAEQTGQEGEERGL